MNKKILLISVLLSFVCISLAVPVFAQTATQPGSLRKEGKTVREATQKNTNAHISNATVTSVSTTSIVISSKGSTITVNTSANTTFRRHFWGSSSISEISPHDMVNVWGTWSDDTHTILTARLVRDISIMKRRGVFFGTVTSKTADGFVMSTINRGNQTITVSSTSRYINRKGQVMSFSAIAEGDKVRVRGMWDKTNSTITQVTEIKDFSLPATISATVTSTPVQ